MMRTRTSSPALVVAAEVSAAAALRHGAAALALEAVFFRCGRRFRLPPALWSDRGLTHELREPIACVLAILSCVRYRRASMTSTPSVVMRVPAIDRSRARVSSSMAFERAASNRNWTAVSTLLTFCPPGPDDRTNRSSSSDSSMTMDDVTVSTLSLFPFPFSLSKPPTEALRLDSTRVARCAGTYVARRAVAPRLSAATTYVTGRMR